MEDKKYKVIPNDAIVDMQVSGFFMMRIQALSRYLANSYGNEQFMEFAKHMIDDKGEPRNEIENHLYTLSGFISDFEVKADEQEKTKELSLDEMKDFFNGN
jgi:hypothetical protein